MITEPTPAMRTVLERLAREDANVPDPTTLPSAEGRALAERTNTRWNVDLPALAQVRETTLAGRRARILVPEHDAGRGAILFVHGGGFCFCSIDTHERAARCLAVEAAAPVVIFDYRLAPEHPCPAGLDDTRAVWPEFAALYPGRALALAGDSAGANLALAAMLAGVDPAPATALLFYGCFGADFDTPSYTLFADGPGLTRGKMMRYFDWYAAADRRADPLVSPINASDAALTALPPLYLNAAGMDPLRSDAEGLAARLHALGRTDPFDLFEGVVHGFMQMTSVLPEANQAIAKAGAAFRQITQTTTGSET